LQVRARFQRRLQRQQLHSSVLRLSLGTAGKGTRKSDDEAGSKANVRSDGHKRILPRKKRRLLTGASVNQR
jgi:hypothetical protein